MKNVILATIMMMLGLSWSFTNPVLNRDFPDPTVMRVSDGKFYVYGTQTANINLQAARSPDLVNWEWLGEVLPEKPKWASNSHRFWAPDVQQHGNTFFMYFAAQPNNITNGMCIGVATSQTPQGPFKDKGTPLLCSTGFSSIDPKSFDDSVTGKIWLFWGSDGAPIRIRELSADRMSFAVNSAPTPLVYPNPNKPYHHLVEGAWLRKLNQWYYLFFSGDNCCGPSAAYAVMVARSASILGPYEVYSPLVVVKSERWLAPGHNSIITDDAGVDWIYYHAISEPTNGDYTRRLLMDKLMYDKSGWPYVGNGGKPSNTTQPNPTVKFVPAIQNSQ